jgi:hypothetical protein
MYLPTPTKNYLNLELISLCNSTSSFNIVGREYIKLFSILLYSMFCHAEGCKIKCVLQEDCLLHILYYKSHVVKMKTIYFECSLRQKTVCFKSCTNNYQKISVTTCASARPQPTRQGNFQEIKTCLG